MMMVLNRQEKEELVLDLYYNQKKTYREIAKEARISPRDIGMILNKASRESQSEHSMSVSSQAYKMFSEGWTPMQVAIALNLRENEVTQYHKEYWSLMKLDALNQIYQEIGGDNIWHFVELYGLTKAAGMTVSHVINLLKIANNYLPSVQRKYEI